LDRNRRFSLLGRRISQETSMTQVEDSLLRHTGFFLSSFFEPEDEGDIIIIINIYLFT
jgi:hypothetical protein